MIKIKKWNNGLKNNLYLIMFFMGWVSFMVSVTLIQAEVTQNADKPLELHIPNLVIEPGYIGVEENDISNQSDSPKADLEKLQFEPMNGDKPILKKRSLMREIESGVEYPDGVEMVVNPEPDFSIKPEAIEDTIEKTNEDNSNVNELYGEPR